MATVSRKDIEASVERRMVAWMASRLDPVSLSDVSQRFSRHAAPVRRRVLARLVKKGVAIQFKGDQPPRGPTATLYEIDPDADLSLEYGL